MMQGIGLLEQGTRQLERSQFLSTRYSHSMSDHSHNIRTRDTIFYQMDN